MLSTAKSHTLTLRLPQELYERASNLARQRQQSVNALLQEGVQRLLQEEEKRALSDGVDLLACYPVECNVDDALSPQAEVVLGNQF